MERTVITRPETMNLKTMSDWITSGTLIVQPDFQRGSVYDTKKASRLVESLFMGIPIPPVYLSQEENENGEDVLLVIDGRQRIESFDLFRTNRLVLSDLHIIPELNGKRYRDLDRNLQGRYDMSSLTAIWILKESDPSAKFDIFARLNQGAVSLNAQEIRNCIYRGPFNKMLHHAAENTPFIKQMFLFKNNRMQYEELILRFFTLQNFMQYKSSMKKEMDAYMLAHQNDDGQESEKLFRTTIANIKSILGEDAFHSIIRNGSNISKFSGSVYDSLAVPFSKFTTNQLMQNADTIRQRINELKHDSQYWEDTYVATGAKERVRGRILAVYNILDSIINRTEPRIFPPEIKTQLWHEGYICSWCHNQILTPDDAEIDHVIPFSQGGLTTIENAQLLHRHCNKEKSNH